MSKSGTPAQRLANHLDINARSYYEPIRMKQEKGECQRCCVEEKILILSLEGMVCYQCAEEIDSGDEED